MKASYDGLVAMKEEDLVGLYNSINSDFKDQYSSYVKTRNMLFNRFIEERSSEIFFY
jgi:hypothetical protein